MKNKGLIITLISVFAVLAIVLIILMVGFISGKIKIPRFDFIYKVSNELIMDQTYDVEFKKIKIKASISDVVLKATNDSNIRIVIYGDKDALNVKTDNEELTVEFKEKECFGFCFDRTKDKIEVYIPSSYDKKILINNDYGDVFIDKFLSSNIEVNEDCGDVSILGGNEIKVKNNYGDIKIGEAKILDIDEDCGDVIIDKANDIKVVNSYGDISIKEVLNYLNATDDCGDIKIDNMTLNKNSTITNDYGDVEIGYTNDIYIAAKTDLGDVDINNNFRKSDIILKIKNNCGDIKIDN